MGRTVVAQVIPTDDDLLSSIINDGPMAARARYMARSDAELDMFAHGMLKILDGTVDPRSYVEVLGPIPPVHPGLRELDKKDI